MSENFDDLSLKVKLRNAIQLWRGIAELNRAKAKRKWEDMESGKVPRSNAITYSMYEDQAEAVAIEDCIADVERILDPDSPFHGRTLNERTKK